MYRRPDIVIYDKKTKKVTIIDIAVPGDVNVVNKERGKRERYPELARELRKIWSVKTQVIPAVVGAYLELQQC